MREALLIARREYLERIRSKAFRVSTVLIPMFFGLIFGVGALSGKLSGGAKNIVVASNDPVLAESERAELMAVAAPSSQLKVEVRAPVTEGDLETLNGEVESKRIDGYLWLNLSPASTQPEAPYPCRGSA